MFGLGLKEAKEMVEGAPVWIKKEVAKAEAEEIIEKLKSVGGELRMAWRVHLADYSHKYYTVHSIDNHQITELYRYYGGREVAAYKLTRSQNTVLTSNRLTI